MYIFRPDMHTIYNRRKDKTRINSTSLQSSQHLQSDDKKTKLTRFQENGKRNTFSGLKNYHRLYYLSFLDRLRDFQKGGADISEGM